VVVDAIAKLRNGIFLLPIGVSLILNGYSQNASEVIINERFSNAPLESILVEIEETNQVRFYFLPEWISEITISSAYPNIPLTDFLEQVFLETNLSFVIYENEHIVIQLPAGD